MESHRSHVLFQLFQFVLHFTRHLFQNNNVVSRSLVHDFCQPPHSCVPVRDSKQVAFFVQLQDGESVNWRGGAKRGAGWEWEGGEGELRKEKGERGEMKCEEMEMGKGKR